MENLKVKENRTGLKLENFPSDTYMQNKCAASHSIHWLVQQSCENKAAGISGRVSMEASSSTDCLLLMCTETSTMELDLGQAL